MGTLVFWMQLKKVLPLVLVLLLFSIAIIVDLAGRVEATGTIYIRADGRIEGTTQIATVDNNTYTFTGDINDSLAVERNNIVIDGTGHTLQGTGSGTGINLSYRGNVTIKNFEVKSFQYGILLYWSSFNIISGNNITDNWTGVQLTSSNNNSIFLNSLKNNNEGIWFSLSSDNRIYHNNYLHYTELIPPTLGSANFWDNGIEGNYWVNYTGVDSNHDGIGDTVRVIGDNNIDSYPLMGVFSDFEATSEHHVQTISNSTVSDFLFENFTDIRVISFNVAGADGITGFCRICIPTALMDKPYQVFVNATEVSYDLLPRSNDTYSYLYFTYSHSTQQVIIIPEFPTWPSILLILTVLTVAIAIYKQRLLKTPIH